MVISFHLAPPSTNPSSTQTNQSTRSLSLTQSWGLRPHLLSPQLSHSTRTFYPPLIESPQSASMSGEIKKNNPNDAKRKAIRIHHVLFVTLNLRAAVSTNDCLVVAVLTALFVNDYENMRAYFQAPTPFHQPSSCLYSSISPFTVARSRLAMKCSLTVPVEALV